MKQLFLCFASLTLLIACGDDKTETLASKGGEEAAPAVQLPYTASYSSDFELGNPEYSATVLQGGWKDWENNTMDNMRNWAADTLVAFHSDNVMVSGVDSLMARWKRGRATYTSVIDTIDAVMPVYSKDRKENWVLVWATEINTNAAGKVDTVYLMETYRINKDGKADMLLQYERNDRN